MRFTQSIHQARAGTHVTLSGEYMVRHAGARTYCQQVGPRAQPMEAQSGRGDGWYMQNFDGTVKIAQDALPLTERQKRADQAFSPRLND